MILLVDAGNTRIKWAFHVGETLLPGGSWSTREVAALPAFALDAGLADSADRVGPEPASRAVVACVAGEAVRGALADAFEGRGIQPHWLTPALSAHGLVNRYQPPQSLGVDRYAALVGALHRVGRSCVVVSVGTATTTRINAGRMVQAISSRVLPWTAWGSGESGRRRKRMTA